MTDLRSDGRIGARRHRDYARQSLRKLTVERAPDPFTASGRIGRGIRHAHPPPRADGIHAFRGRASRVTWRSRAWSCSGPSMRDGWWGLSSGSCRATSPITISRHRLTRGMSTVCLRPRRYRDRGACGDEVRWLTSARSRGRPRETTTGSAPSSGAGRRGWGVPPIYVAARSTRSGREAGRAARTHGGLLLPGVSDRRVPLEQPRGQSDVQEVGPVLRRAVSLQGLRNGLQQLHGRSRILRPGARSLLDVACGTGKHLECLRAHYRRRGGGCSAPSSWRSRCPPAYRFTRQTWSTSIYITPSTS